MSDISAAVIRVRLALIRGFVREYEAGNIGRHSLSLRIIPLLKNRNRPPAAKQKKGIVTMTELEKAGTALARPVGVLLPLIKREIAAGDEEREQAGIEHYRKAGEMLLEIKESKQIPHGEWAPWTKRMLNRGPDTIRHYMKLAEMVKSRPRTVFESVRQAARPDASTYGPRWNEPVKEIIARVDVGALAEQRQNAEKERRLLRQLGVQLTDIGYKVLAAQLHPDKSGGSKEGMTRLNRVRAILKDAI